MAGMLVLDLTTEYIFAFFTLCLLANYNSFMSLWILTSGVQLYGRITLGSKYRVYFIAMNVAYIALTIIAAIPATGNCTPENVYPVINSMLPIIFMINCIFSMYLKFKNYHKEDWHLDHSMINSFCEAEASHDDFTLFSE